jgi:hypothetical protein
MERAGRPVRDRRCRRPLSRGEGLASRAAQNRAGRSPLYEGEPVTGTVLQVLTEELDAGGVIYRASSDVDPLSLQRTRRTAYWSGVPFVRQLLDDLSRPGRDLIESLET